MSNIFLIAFVVCLISLVQLIPINFEVFNEPEVEHNLDDRNLS